ncbi:hypothetical protein Tco_0469582 [Tanacetum coccineum]
MQKEKEQQDKLKAVKACLLYGNESGRNPRNHEESSEDSSKTDLLHLGSSRGRREVCLIGWEEKNEARIHALIVTARVPKQREPRYRQESIIMRAHRPEEPAVIQRAKTAKGVTGSPNKKGIDTGHSTDECMQLRKQIDEMIKAGKTTSHPDDPIMGKSSQAKGNQSFSPEITLSFLPLGDEDGTEGPMIIEAEIGGHFVHQMSPSQHNGIIGRPGIRKIHAIPSTAHGMLKFPIEGGTVTLRSSRIIPMECAMIFGPSTRPLEAGKTLEEKIRVVIHPEYLEQTIAIGSTLTEKGRKELCTLLGQNLDVFAWKPADMTGVPRHTAEHRLNVRKGCSPMRQKKRGQAPERNKAIQEEVEKFQRSKQSMSSGWLPTAGDRLESRISLRIPLQMFSRRVQGVSQKKWQRRMQKKMFLGYKVNTDGLKVCPDKADAVLSFSSPRCLKDVQKLNGKLASLNMFLSKSAKKSLPFFKTLKKCTKKSDFQWTQEAEAAFKQMKKLIAELPMDSGGRSSLQTNRILGHNQRSNQCSLNDGHGRQTSTSILCKPCSTRARDQLYSHGKAGVSLTQCKKMAKKIFRETSKFKQVLVKVSRKITAFLQNLEKVHKKSDFQWTQEAEAAFKQMKKYRRTPMLTAPMEKEELSLYLASSQNKPGGREGGGARDQLYSHGKAGLSLTQCKKMAKKIFPSTHNCRNNRPTNKATAVEPRTAIKVQILADFIVERPEEESPNELMTEREELPEP